VFNRGALDRILEQKFGNAGFWEVRKRMCIPAVEGRHGEVHIYKTPHHPDYRLDWRRSVLEVARATSAAPVYLEAVEQAGYALVDGGLFANDPIMVALIDVLACFDVPREKIRILSLGCLRDTWSLHEVQSLGTGWLAWTLRAYEVTGSLQSQNAQGQAGLLIGPENILRINATQPTPRINLDDWRGARTCLPEVADKLLEENSARVNQMFFQEPVEAHVPFYTPERPSE
jgi:patatin-like phospholipase/acyl hydrolase